MTSTSVGVGEAILNFIQSPLGVTQLQGQQTEVSKAIKITVVSLAAVVVSYATSRIINDILSIALTGVSTYADIKNKIGEIKGMKFKKTEDTRS